MNLRSVRPKQRDLEAQVVITEVGAEHWRSINMPLHEKRRVKSLTPEKERLKKHHKDRYLRSYSNSEREEEWRFDRCEEGAITTREVARKALSRIATSPLSRRLQEA